MGRMDELERPSGGVVDHTPVGAAGTQIGQAK
jgi:hypothetical protein